MKNIFLFILLFVSMSSATLPRAGFSEGYPPNDNYVSFITPDPTQIWPTTNKAEIPVGYNATIPVQVRIYNWRPGTNIIGFEIIPWVSRGSTGFGSVFSCLLPPGASLDTTVNFSGPAITCRCTLQIDVLIRTFAGNPDSSFCSRNNPILVVGDTIPPVVSFTYPRNRIDSVAAGSTITATWTLTDNRGVLTTRVIIQGVSSTDYNGSRTSASFTNPPYTFGSWTLALPLISIFARDSNNLCCQHMNPWGYLEDGVFDTVLIYDPPPHVTIDKSKLTENVSTSYQIKWTSTDQLKVIVTSLYCKIGGASWAKLDSPAVSPRNWTTPSVPSLCSLVVMSYDTSRGVGRDTLVVNVTNTPHIVSQITFSKERENFIPKIYDIRGRHVSPNPRFSVMFFRQENGKSIRVVQLRK